MDLIVTHAFGDYAVGDRITDEAEARRIRGGEQQAFVVNAAPLPVPSPVEPQEAAEPGLVALPAPDADLQHGGERE